MSKVILTQKGMSNEGKTRINKILKVARNAGARSKKLRIKTLTEYNNVRADLLECICSAAKYYSSTMEEICEDIFPILTNSGVDVLVGVYKHPTKPEDMRLLHSSITTTDEAVILLAIDTEIAFNTYIAACLQYDRTSLIRKSLQSAGLIVCSK